MLSKTSHIIRDLLTRYNPRKKRCGGWWRRWIILADWPIRIVLFDRSGVGAPIWISFAPSFISGSPCAYLVYFCTQSPKKVRHRSIPVDSRVITTFDSTRLVDNTVRVVSESNPSYRTYCSSSLLPDYKNHNAILEVYTIQMKTVDYSFIIVFFLTQRRMSWGDWICSSNVRSTPAYYTVPFEVNHISTANCVQLFQYKTMTCH